MEYKYQDRKSQTSSSALEALLKTLFCLSSVKLLEEIKLLLERNPNRERLFRRTVFERWLDILSHDNDNHLMHYVLLHQVHVSKIPSDCPSMIFHIGDHWLQFGRKEFCLITGF
ncbi:hypothetical protein Tco_1051410 [Tanacetum coccineum]